MLDHTGLYGVESTYLYLAEAFARLGFEPYIFTSSQEAHEYKGVHYVNFNEWTDYSNRIAFDVVITSRHENIFDDLYNGLKILWLQDFSTWRTTSENKWAHGQNHTVVSSNAHKDAMMRLFPTQVGKSNISVIPITIDKTLYDNYSNITKDPYRIIYSTAPDRGLENLLDIWSTLTEEIPEINLHIFYGMDSIRKVAESRGNVEYADKFINLINDYVNKFDNIVYHNIVKKSDLAVEQMKGSLGVYPLTWFETFCLSAYEYQLAGMPTIANMRGGLNDSFNQYNNFYIQGEQSTPYVKNKYINTIKHLLTQPDQVSLKNLQNMNRTWAEENVPTWDDVANIWKKLIYKNLK